MGECMFKENDTVVYKNAGLCRVETIGVPEFITTDEIYYKLQTLTGAGNIIYVKEGHEDMIRPIISKEETEDYLDKMKDLEGLYDDNNKAREREFSGILGSGNLMDVLRMYKGLFQARIKRQQAGKHLNASDEQDFVKADRMLCGEFSVALGTSTDNIRDILTRACAS
ncbi:MAG: CarD family transcriptional regulator [Lachnospiraceae bacterium]|nr:CarD family transcriptional regulator [Lachnospiraceae bacterium]